MLIQAQQAVMDYLKKLDKKSAAEELEKIVKPTDDGATINGKEVRRLFDKLGYGNAGFTYDFAGELTELYREVCQ